VERLDKAWGILDVRCGFPGIIARVVAFPLDEVEQAFAIVLGVKNLFDFIFGCRFDDDRRRWRTNAVRNRGRMIGLEE